MIDAKPAGNEPVFDGLGWRAALVIAILMLINMVNFIDRQLPFILIQAIKADLKLTDSEIGLMAGLSFALVFSLAWLPLAYLAARWIPRHMLALTLARWSLLIGLMLGGGSTMSPIGGRARSKSKCNRG